MRFSSNELCLSTGNHLWRLRLILVRENVGNRSVYVLQRGVTVGGLTERQQQCLEGVLQLKTAKQIGRELGITHHAVEKHLKAAREKLGANDTHHAARKYAAITSTAEPYYGLSDLPRPANYEAGQRRRQGYRMLLRDVATEDRGIVYDFSPLQVLIAIAGSMIGIATILAMLIAVAQGIDLLTR